MVLSSRLTTRVMRCTSFFFFAGGGSVGSGLALADDAVVQSSTMDAAFEEQLKEGAEAFEFQAEV